MPIYIKYTISITNMQITRNICEYILTKLTNV
jgi:hypothetical protein